MDDSIQEILRRSKEQRGEAFARMSAAETREAIGVVSSITGSEGRLSVKLQPWRWAGGPLEQGELYVWMAPTSSREQRVFRRTFPEHTVVRLVVRPDLERRPGGELWDALAEHPPQHDVDDGELAKLAAASRSANPPRLYRPEFDFRWECFDALGRLLPAPPVETIPLGGPLPEGGWLSVRSPKIFDGCDVLRRQATGGGEMMVGVIGDRVEAVWYDLETYRTSPFHRLRKLRHLIDVHSPREDKLRRILDNRVGAMLYRNLSANIFAIYAYNTDIVIVHTWETSFSRSE